MKRQRVAPTFAQTGTRADVPYVTGGSAQQTLDLSVPWVCVGELSSRSHRSAAEPATALTGMASGDDPALQLVLSFMRNTIAAHR
jgi:hypothetical protein